MYLKSIKAQGFKSFADKLDLEINPGITGIVGPNGSGKSNIVDAVRWVLGEQSVKSLRGQNSMSDVIFSGSESREAQKRAYVSLTFDNSDKLLNSEFREIEIKRVVYITGENEYFINNSRVRLKDITDLFIDAGAGSSAFNIISQGNVTDIVNSKSSDRRVIFESAAGVLKYKRRKEESLRKLEKTEENLMRINLVINELKDTVLPLKEQSEKAEKYLGLKNELETIDIALIVRDITDINNKYSALKNEVDVLKSNLSESDTIKLDGDIERLKLKILELEDNLNKKREKDTEIASSLSKLESERLITLERQKYEANSNTINENLLKLKETELNLSKNIDVLTKEIALIDSNISEKRNSLEETKNEILKLQVRRSTINNNILEYNKNIFVTENKITILENNMNSMSSSPASIKNVLSNPRLKGIHNTIGKVLTIPEKYLTATDVALGSSSNYVIVDTDEDALKAIEFLKEKNLGRATFFPISVIKGRNIDEKTLSDIKNIDGFIGILSDLVEYDSIYKNIIENQLGNVIVVKTGNTLKTIGKLINYKYRIVSLDGEILHAGGSITGGSVNKNKVLNEKKELNDLKQTLDKLNIEVNSLNDNIKSINAEYEKLDLKENELSKNILELNELKINKLNTFNTFKKEYESVTSEISGLDNMLAGSLDEKLLELLENINSLNKQKEILSKDIMSVSNEKSELNDKLNELEAKQKEINTIYREQSNLLKDKEIAIGKMEVTLDNLLVTLNNEYNLTFDNAINNYTLEIDVDIARSKVNSLKKDMNKLGNVNLGAIDEYDRLNKRYEFLNTQKDDLEKSSQELKEIIGQMDDIMIDKFKNTFNKISVEFSRMFKLMFKGGHGELKLTDANDLLNTGIDIIVNPPGKKINSPMSLSGGEKALTAIVLLFAMLQVRPSPFVILDEAEAALDEVNVDMFGKYLNSEKEKSQFIVITHKKRMMEYADSLYGITMQESGVSKIVSAKLEGIK